MHTARIFKAGPTRIPQGLVHKNTSGCPEVFLHAERSLCAQPSFSTFTQDPELLEA